MHEPDERDSDVPDNAMPPPSAALRWQPEDSATQVNPPVIDVDSIEWAPDPGAGESAGPGSVAGEGLSGSSALGPAAGESAGSGAFPGGALPDDSRSEMAPVRGGVGWLRAESSPWPEAAQTDSGGAYAYVPPPPPVPSEPVSQYGEMPPPHSYQGRVGRGRLPIPTWGIAVIGVAILLVIGAVAVVALRGGDGFGGNAAQQVGSPGGIGEGTTLIVGPTGVVGSWTGSEWQPRGDGDQPGAGFEFTVVGLEGRAISATGKAVSESCASQGGTSQQDVSVPLDSSDGASPPAIAVAGVEDPRPRPVELLDVGSATYRQAAADVAKGLGAGTPATVTQILRTDLDGNGTDEVVVAAEHRSDPGGSAKAGDWSIVFLRRLMGDDQVATDVLAASVVENPGDPLDRTQVSAIADLNGDGSLELVLNGKSLLEEWTAIHAFPESGEAGGVSEVLQANCEA